MGTPRPQPIPPPPAAAGEAAHGPLSPPQARALRRRLLERVAEADERVVTVTAAQGEWQPWLPGIALKVLDQGGERLSMLLRLAPGAALPARRHPLDEELVVLDGRLRVGRRQVLGPGSYQRAPRGALHPTMRSDIGALVFVRGAMPMLDDAIS